MKRFLHITAIVIVVLAYANHISAQIADPKIILHIENNVISKDFFAAVIKKATPSKAKLKLSYDEKTIILKIPYKLMDNVDSIEIYTFNDFSTKEIDIIEAFVYNGNPVYQCYQCTHRLRKTRIYLYKDWGKAGI